MKTYNYYVYIVTNFNRTVIYTGVTNSLTRRVTEHYQGLVEGFTKKYRCKYLVYYEYFFDINLAIAREKQIKKWRRKKKNELILKFNPEWKFLNESTSSIEESFK